MLTGRSGAMIASTAIITHNGRTSAAPVGFPCAAEEDKDRKDGDHGPLPPDQRSERGVTGPRRISAQVHSRPSGENKFEESEREDVCNLIRQRESRSAEDDTETGENQD